MRMITQAEKWGEAELGAGFSSIWSFKPSLNGKMILSVPDGEYLFEAHEVGTPDYLVVEAKIEEELNRPWL